MNNSGSCCVAKECARPAGLAEIGAGLIRPVDGTITLRDRWDHLLARWGVNRMGHRVEPGLYAMGQPGKESPVLVTANYTLSFDALRTALAGTDCYLLVLDTKGINVWCAAGKGTFGTDELVGRIEATGLAGVVEHRVVILPQLGAPGVSAHEVRQRSGFKVEYGPVRATDLPAYLQTRQATPEMRRVRFSLIDRLVLIPVELVHLIPWLLFFGFIWSSQGAVLAILAGTVLFPILLPWLPTSRFSTKGYILGGVVALAFALLSNLGKTDLTLWMRAGRVLALTLSLSSVTAFLALNFTGSTTFTSRTGVKREIATFVPVMAWLFGTGIVLQVVLGVVKRMGG